MADVGSLALVAAFALSLYAIAASIIGYYGKRNDLIISAERSMLSSLGMVVLASMSLVALLLQSDFTIDYVARYSNKDLPLFYKFSSFWAGQAGSLLLWLLILSIVANIAMVQNRNKNREIMPFVMVVLSTVCLFFITVNLFLTNPFDELVANTAAAGLVPYAPPDGNGLNPLLQHPAMVIHPPILFTGYSIFAIPFAFALAALITGKLDATWIKSTRRWTLAGFMFLTAGIILGGGWAYVELGWGGYWAWDPVENASLMPWLTGTAYLHSVIIQEKRGMLKVWNMALVILTFTLCIFGTFLTRSGIVSSVHSFAESSIGPVFSTFLFFIIIVAGAFLIKRLPELRGEQRFDSLLSRESSFLFNNLILFGAMFATLWGTIFPIISEAFTGQQITVGQPFFNTVNIPIGLFLLFLTGVGPLFAWRQTTAYSLKRNFFYPLATSLVAAVGLYIAGIRAFYPLLSFVLCFFVFYTVVQEFAKGMLARRKHLKESFATALVNLTMKNTRRYGGYIVHVGIILLFIGFTGSAFNVQDKANLTEGERVKIGDYELAVESINHGRTVLYQFSESFVSVYKDGEKVSLLQPSRRHYLASDQPSTEVALYSTLKEDVYVVFAGMENDKGVFMLYLNPLVMFVWIGGVVIVLGTIIAMLPNFVGKKNPDYTKEVSAEKAIKENV